MSQWPLCKTVRRHHVCTVEWAVTCYSVPRVITAESCLQRYTLLSLQKHQDDIESSRHATEGICAWLWPTRWPRLSGSVSKKHTKWADTAPSGKKENLNHKSLPPSDGPCYSVLPSVVCSTIQSAAVKMYTAPPIHHSHTNALRGLIFSVLIWKCLWFW